jgi:hypothetical protein
MLSGCPIRLHDLQTERQGDHWRERIEALMRCQSQSPPVATTRGAETRPCAFGVVLSGKDGLGAVLLNDEGQATRVAVALTRRDNRHQSASTP